MKAIYKENVRILQKQKVLNLGEGGSKWENREIRSKCFQVIIEAKFRKVL